MDAYYRGRPRTRARRGDQGKTCRSMDQVCRRSSREQRPCLCPDRCLRREWSCQSRRSTSRGNRPAEESQLEQPRREEGHSNQSPSFLEFRFIFQFSQYAYFFSLWLICFVFVELGFRQSAYPLGQHVILAAGTARDESSP